MLSLLFTALLAQAPAEPFDPPDPHQTVVSAPRPLPPPPPSNSYPQLGSALEFDALVDLQTRGRAEAQGDVTIRGGLFESTGVSLGPVGLFDPQTGHYLLELPVPASMVGPPTILSGLDNAQRGFNATAGSIAHRWAPVRPALQLSTDLGPYGANSQHGYLARRWELGGGFVLGADLDAGHAGTDGELPETDRSGGRVAARLQLASESSQSELFAGYQAKFVAWPCLYALRALHQAVGSSGAETDRMETWLVLASHEQRFATGTELQLSGYYRLHQSDYELDRHAPGRFNPYRHETRVWAVGARLRQTLGPMNVVASAQLLWDRLESTSLTFGPFTSRRYLKAGLAPEVLIPVSRDWTLVPRAGVTLDESDREGIELAPQAELAAVGATQPVRQRYYLQYSRATQVPGYTALGSSATSGLFRGNPDLRRSRADNFEAGARLEHSWARGGLAVFHRRDEGLVDWTYASALAPFSARQANPLDLSTTGVEATVQGGPAWLRVQAGYAFLSKSAEYAGAADASFYALNYPTHRVVLGLVARPLSGLEVRSDNQLRVEAENALRKGPYRVLLSALRLAWTPEPLAWVRLTASVDNLWDVRFEQVPGVPGAPRTFALGLEVRQ